MWDAAPPETGFQAQLDDPTCTFIVSCEGRKYIDEIKYLKGCTLLEVRMALSVLFDSTSLVLSASSLSSCPIKVKNAAKNFFKKKT